MSSYTTEQMIEDMKTTMEEMFAQMIVNLNVTIDRVFDRVMSGAKTVEQIKVQTVETNQNLVGGCSESENIENIEQSQEVQKPNNQTPTVNSVKVNCPCLLNFSTSSLATMVSILDPSKQFHLQSFLYSLSPNSFSLDVLHKPNNLSLGWRTSLKLMPPQNHTSLSSQTMTFMIAWPIELGKEELHSIQGFDNAPCFMKVIKVYEQTHFGYVVKVEGTDRLNKGFVPSRKQQRIKRFESDQCMSNRGLFTHLKYTIMIDVHNMVDEMPERKSGSWNTFIIELGNFGNGLEFGLWLLLVKEFMKALDDIIRMKKIAETMGTDAMERIWNAYESNSYFEEYTAAMEAWRKLCKTEETEATMNSQAMVMVWNDAGFKWFGKLHEGVIATYLVLTMTQVWGKHSVKETVMQSLKSDPKLVDIIETKCSKDSWNGITRRLWPNTSSYFFGVNLKPFCKPSEVSYTLIFIMAYFESGEWLFIANLVAANCYKSEYLKRSENWAFVENAKCFYLIEIFLIIFPYSIQLVDERTAANHQVFSINPSASFIHEFFKEVQEKILPHVDFVFGKEKKARIFSNTHSYKVDDVAEIALKISQWSEASGTFKRITVITQGAEPVVAAEDGKMKQFFIILSPQEKLVENGASDVCVGSFLSQLIQEKPIEVCVKVGCCAFNYIIHSIINMDVDVSTMLRGGQKTILLMIKNGDCTIEAEIHDETNNMVTNWNYTGLIDAIHNAEGKFWAAKVICEKEFHEAIVTTAENLQPKYSTRMARELMLSSITATTWFSSLRTRMISRGWHCYVSIGSRIK